MPDLILLYTLLSTCIVSVKAEWEKSERKAKEYEKERRMSVRRAREQASKDLASLAPPPLPDR